MSWHSSADELMPRWTSATETQVIETSMPLLDPTLKIRSLKSVP